MVDNKQKYLRMVRIINSYDFSSLSDEDLKDKTDELRLRLKDEDLEDVLPIAYALVKEATKRFHPEHIVYHDVQLFGGIALFYGDVAQMQTGEGKTITAILPAYLQALKGNGVHVVTSNDYLATRDMNTLKGIYEGLGLSVGLVTEKRDSNLEDDISNRKKSYACDVTYGSGNAFVFDYLRDNNVSDINAVVGRDKPGVAILDEVDVILINDAMIPYIMSSSSDRIVDDNHYDLVANANDFVYKLYSEDLKRRKENIGRGIVRLFQTEEGAIVERSLNDPDYEYFAIGSLENKSIELTTRGFFEAFKYFNKREIDKLALFYQDEFKSDSEFVLGDDYVISRYGFSLTDKGLDKAISSGRYTRFNDLNNRWYSDKKVNDMFPYITNALKAYFVMQNGLDYGLLEVEDGYKVCSISGGRMNPDRVYGDGLQDAIEAKEKLFSLVFSMDRKIVSSKEGITVASITPKSFYERYDAVCGMTGTASSSLTDLYGFDITVVPRHMGDAKRVEHGDTLFLSEEDKLEAVINDVLLTHRKGQPVLVTTMSVSESKAIAEALRRNGMEVSLLNAESSDLEEARVISCAGKKGMITVTTEMAGRGTDIKLGGEYFSMRDDLLSDKVKRLMSDHNLSYEDAKGRLEDYISNNVEVQALFDAEVIDALKSAKEEVVNLGGLKLIGCGHFKTERDDRQLIGRVSRQDDPGEVVFYTSINDLEELNVSLDVIRMLKSKYEFPLSSRVVDDVIHEAQVNNEAMMAEVIANNQEKDAVISEIRNSVYRQRRALLNGSVDSIDTINYMAEVAMATIMSQNVLEGAKDKADTKVSKSKVDFDGLSSSIERVFGVFIEPSDMRSNFIRLKDISNYVTESVKSRNVDAVDSKKKIVEFLDDTYVNFLQMRDFIKFDGYLHLLGRDDKFDEKSVIKRKYNQLMVQSRVDFISSMFGTGQRDSLVEEDNGVGFEVCNNDYNLGDFVSGVHKR